MSKPATGTHVIFDSFSFGRAVYKRMSDEHLNHTQLAKKLGMHQTTLSRVTYGKMPTVDNLVALMQWGKWDLQQFVIERTIYA